jgi:hypothetical protein
MGCRVEIYYFNYISLPSTLHTALCGYWALIYHYLVYSVTPAGVTGLSVWIYDRPPHRPALCGWSQAEGLVYHYLVYRVTPAGVTRTLCLDI